MRACLMTLFVFACCATVLAEVRLPALFSDGMVLQRNAPVLVWGWAAPGEAINISLDQQKVATTAYAGGMWKAALKPMKEGGPYEMTVAGKNSLTIKDILIGEVWVCSGQSNMEWTVNRAANFPQEAVAANYPHLRMFTVAKQVADTPRGACAGRWTACTPQSVGAFSAVGYFYARELHQTLQVPIGMIHTSWGGTIAEAWTSREALEAMPMTAITVKALDSAAERYSRQMYTEYGTALKEWLAAADQAVAANTPFPPMPMHAQADPRAYQNSPTVLYNGMIAPLIPYRIAGAIWYQGESNAGRAAQYRTLFPAMISDWRQRWGQGDFPFYFVQLANFMAAQKDPGENSGWAELREAQAMTLALPNTGMATIIDIGEAGDIHPKNKQDVGKRLALNALAKTYGKDVVHSGPTYAGMTVEGATIRIKFSNLGGGLVVKGDKLKGFVVCGEDKKFAWADAVVEGDTVVVSSTDVRNPVAARYAFANNPECNLYNKAGLPAVPFRTDAPK